MRPELWTVWGTHFTIPTYGFICLVGFVVAVWIAVRRAKKAGGDPEAITTIALIGGVFGILGSRGMHFVHYLWDGDGPGERPVTETAAAMLEGGEILGGVLLGVAAIVVYLAATRKPVRLYLDIIVAPMILAMGIGRLGCLMAGCCWGSPCVTQAGDAALPWAVRFPYGSPAYLRQWVDGLLTTPDELLWVMPGAERPSPIPPKILADGAIDGHHALSRYAEHRSEARALEGALPGRSRQQKAEYVAAALHLRELSARAGRPVTLANLREVAAGQHTLWIHPTQIYDAIALTLLFLVLSAVFHRRQRQVMVVAWTMVLYPISRFTQELIRADSPRDVGGLTISQFLSLVVLLLGVVLLVLLVKVLPPRSPRTGRGFVQPAKAPA